MEIDKEKQAQTIDEVARRLHLAEKERADFRLSKGILELEQQNFSILFNDEFVERLPQYLCDCNPDDSHKPVTAVLDNIGAGCLNEDQKVRERALIVLSVFSDCALENGNNDFIRKVSSIFVKWLEIETEYLSGFSIICQQLQKIGMSLLEKKFWIEAYDLLVLLSRIQGGVLEKSNSIKGIAAKALEGLATKEVLESLTLSYLDESDRNQKTAGDLLQYLGRRSAIFLLNKLMHSENKEERFHLMHLIPKTGNVAVSVFEECLKKNPPWYVIRNIVCMIAEIGDHSLFFLVEPYFLHPDIRVQQQAIVCVGDLGGQMMQKRLLTALPKVHDDLKVKLVMRLSQFKGDDVTDALLDLFEGRKTFSSSIADELLFTLCIAVKSTPCQRALKNLKQLVAERKKTHSGADRILAVAEEAISVVGPKVRREAKNDINAVDELSFDSDPALEHEAKKRIRDFIEEVYGVVGRGDVGKASAMLFAEAVKSARNKDFKVAEILRDKILDVNPMALSEVLEAGEIIEEERGATITSHHIETWSALYEKMTTDEFTALYHAMKHQTYNPEEPIVKTGETDPSLYFVNSGLVRLSCKCGEKETFLKRLQPGEIMGVGQFFSVSVWTVSLTAQSLSQIHVLEREDFLALKQRFPDLEEKLHDFCLQYDSVPALLIMTGDDRREYARYPISLIINSIVLDPYGKKGQRAVKGEMIDISRGGLSFVIRISNAETAKLLLGRQVISEIQIGPENILRCPGKIVGVRFPKNDNQEFSVHVKFYSAMENADVMRISKLIL